MKRILFALAAAASLSSCAPAQKPAASLWRGGRDFQIDEKASLGVVKVSATSRSGASDSAKIEMLLNALADSRRLTRFQKASIEDGVVYCFGFANDGVKTTAYALLKSIDTDPSSTQYQVGSGESCQPRSEADGSAN